MNVNPRSRTYTWEDPIALRDAGATMSGLDYLNAVFGGKLPPPPIAQTLDFTGAEVDEGRAVFTSTPGEFLYNPIGVVHGGFAMTILDSAMGCAIHSMLAAGEGYTSLDTSVNFVLRSRSRPGVCAARVRSSIEAEGSPLRRAG